MTASRARARRSGGIDLGRAAERALRSAADPRLAILLLVALGLANGAAAVAPQLQWVLDSPVYLVAVGAAALSGVAAVAVRAPAAWREWRTPGPLPARGDTLEAAIAVEELPDAGRRERIVILLRGSGYRTVARASGERWVVHGVRRGWSRFAGLATHIAFVGLAIGAALGSAFANETVFSLLPGEQALLAAARPGFTSSVRLDRFDGEFGPDGRPTRLDTTVTFIRDGAAVRSQVLRVNEPGTFDGHLVHGWTYGPAIALRIVDLGGRPLLDAEVPLDDLRDEVPTGFVELPGQAVTVGLSLTDPARNLVRVTVAGALGTLDSAVIGPSQERRLGDALVTLVGFTSYVTFLSRSDPGMAPLFAAAGLLVLTLAIAYYLPRRRCSVRLEPQRVVVQLRGERFESPVDELERLVARVRGAL